MNAIFNRLTSAQRSPGGGCPDQHDPNSGSWADKLPALLDEISPSRPTRDDLVTVIQGACGENLSGASLARIADAVLELYR
jgi:hypothetical protein